VKLPRDVSGETLARSLKQFGYQVIRQNGSHVRLTSSERGFEHHVTIPSHKQLKVGTLSAILSEIAEYLEMSRDELAAKLFGR
jgi:predicted RNA binding protein YcfA (HicA-like mRNA interferase family)